MGLITYTNLEDGTPVTANVFNERFAQVIKEINGLLDQNNLADNAVTSSKYADGSLTNNKIDDNTITPQKLSAIAFDVQSAASNQNITAGTMTKVALSVLNYEYGGDNFDISNQRFIAPVSGVYQLNGRVTFTTAANLAGNFIYMDLRVNGVTRLIGTNINAGGNNSTGIVAAGAVYLNAGDYVEMWAKRDTQNGQLTGSQSELSGFCVGATV